MRYGRSLLSCCSIKRFGYKRRVKRNSGLVKSGSISANLKQRIFALLERQYSLGLQVQYGNQIGTDAFASALTNYFIDEHSAYKIERDPITGNPFATSEAVFIKLVNQLNAESPSMKIYFRSLFRLAEFAISQQQSVSKWGGSLRQYIGLLEAILPDEVQMLSLINGAVFQSSKELYGQNREFLSQGFSATDSVMKDAQSLYL